MVDALVRTMKWLMVAMVAMVAALLVTACRDREPAPAPEPPRVIAIDATPPAKTCDPGEGTYCVDDTVKECTADGQAGRTVMTCKLGCKRGACIDTCAAKDVELVYVVDRDSQLLSFDPRKLPNGPFTRVGKLDCGTSESPFSMAVDNRGVAWVLFTDGTLFRASILDAHCARTGHAVDKATIQFGMGFAGDGAGGEKLYVADDNRLEGAPRDGKLATVDTSGDKPVYEPIGILLAQQVVSPELTGTSDGKLYGYFPDPKRGFIREIDRKTARGVGPKRFLPDIGEVGAFAFAHWGGTFYIFASNGDAPSAVHAIERKTGKYRLVLAQTEHQIVGAGVSTCAPLLERVP